MEGLFGDLSAFAGGLGDRVNDATKNPLFHMGLGLMSDDNIGRGLANGMRSYQGAQKFQIEQDASTREQERQKQLDAYIQESLPEQDRALAMAAPDRFAQSAIQSKFTQPKAPHTRKRFMGQNVVQEEYDATAKKWNQIGEGPRFAPNRLNDPSGRWQVVQTSEGWARANPVTGEIQPFTNEGGQSALPTAADVGLAGRKSEATALGKELGKQRGAAQMDMGGALAKADQSIALIDKMIAHAGREDATGTSSILNPVAIPGSDRKDFLVMGKQLEGKAFLEAFESLKGGGHITEIEGQKATEAMARLDTAQSEEAYLEALQELRGIMSLGRQRSMARARVSSEQGAPQQGAPIDDLINKYLGDQ